MKKILFAVMACVLSIGLIGGAFAYFTDVEYSTGNVMSAGTLDMQIADNDQGYSNNPVTATFNSPAGLAPGDVFATNAVYFKNVGTANINWVWARFCNLVEGPGIQTDAEEAIAGATDISKYIILKSTWESVDGGSTYSQTAFDEALANVYLQYWYDRGANLAIDGEISLADLIEANDHGSGDRVTSLLFLNEDPPALAPGEIGSVYFTFQLSELTTNAYQGDTATFEVDFIGSARNVYPDELLADSITEALGQP